MSVENVNFTILFIYDCGTEQLEWFCLRATVKETDSYWCQNVVLSNKYWSELCIYNLNTIDNWNEKYSLECIFNQESG